MGQAEANAILECYGLPILKNTLLTSPEEIEAKLAGIGFPVAMKIASPDIVHKFDAGGVKLNITSTEAAKTAYAEIIANAKAYKADAVIQGIYAEQMAPKGTEVILGAVRDPQFGPLCMFGMGGTICRSDERRQLPPRADVGSQRRSHDPVDQGLQDAYGLPGEPARRHRRD